MAWRLLGLTMPLTILAIALLGWSILGLGLASALLLGAALAPTDPVLASDVQVGPPHEGMEDEVRFALTAEAGLNDGLSFPFVYLAIALALSQASGTEVRFPGRRSSPLCPRATPPRRSSQSVGRELTTAQKYATGAVRHRPYQSVALVIGLGALIAFFVRR